MLEVRPKPATPRPSSEPTQINEASALWTRPKAEITDEQYSEFYHHVAHAFDEPFARVHFTAEGTLCYTALLFVPGRARSTSSTRSAGTGSSSTSAASSSPTTREPDAALSALRRGRGRQRGPAAQRQPRDAAARRVIARMRKALVKRLLDELARQGEGRAPPRAERGQGRARQLRRLVGRVRRGAQGGHLRGRRATASGCWSWRASAARHGDRLGRRSPTMSAG